jgi:IPT/TIG domain-containing protein
VSSVSPSAGYVGTPVTIHGTNFASGAVTFFGGTPALTNYISSIELQAIVPSKISSKTTFNVTVQVNGLVSTYNPPHDDFTFLPSVVAVLAPEGQPGLKVNVTGIGFTRSSEVNFSSTGASFSFVNSTLLVGTVPSLPSSTAVFDVSVGGPPHPGDQFVFVPLSATLSTTSAVISAEPIFLHPTPNATTEAVVASYSSNDSIELLTSTNSFSTYATRWVGSFNVSLGSPLLSNLGGTRIQIPGGTAGEVTAASAGPYVFIAFTSRELEENSVRTIVSNTSGSRWSSPYLVASTNGSVDGPQATVSPAGYVFLTWRANGQGGWSAEQRVFSDSGRPLGAASSIPGTGGVAGTVVQSLTVAVDGWQRPLYVWSYVNRTGVSVIDYTGAYLTVRQLVSLIWQRFNQTVPSDFRTFGSSQISAFESGVTSALGTVLSDIHSRSYSAAQTEIVADLYPYLTVNRTLYAYAATAGDPYACSSGLGTAATWLSNTSGPYSTGTSFRVYAAWLVEASGCGAIALPQWPGVPGGAQVPTPAGGHPSGFPPPPVLGSIQAPYSTSWGYVNITPVTVNPNAVLLSAQSAFRGNSTNSAIHVSGCYGYNDRSYYPASYSEQVTNPLGAATAPAVFTSHDEVPSVYLTSLQPNFNGTWGVRITVSFNESYTKSETCGGVNSQSSGMEAPTLGPAKLTFSLSGTYTTYLGSVPTPPPLKILTNGATHQATLYSNFTASVMAAIHLFSITEQGGGYYGSNSTTVGATKENISLSGVPVLGSSTEFWATFELNSSAGSVSKAWPQINASQVTRFFHPLWANYTYEFQSVANPVGLFLNHTPVVNITGTDASVAWYSNMSGTGWVRYQESGSGQFQQTAQRWSLSSNDSWFRYTLELHGLDPWSIYTLWIGVDASPPSDPVVYEKYTAITFQTTPAVTLSEWEAPYDSITGEGGGALIYWNWPIDFFGYTYENGNLTYWPSNQSPSESSVLVPIPQLNQFTVGYDAGVFGVNLTGLGLNWTYNVSLLLNISYNGKTLAISSEPFQFQYERDTSGDGLTDWEKIRGWNVTTQDDGVFLTATETGNPELKSTNGLTGDFLEKEFGLNPNTISTTNDGMLDTWNLTFNLGQGSPALPTSGFDYWYENSSYQFTHACAAPEFFPHCTFAPIYSNISNLTDNGPGSAMILWSGVGASSALHSLQGLVTSEGVSPLRAVTGSYKGLRTITVWGKLSWGADPLSWSTTNQRVGSGVPGDGGLVNPLGVADLNVTLTSWSMDCLSNGVGVAAFINAVSNATPFLPSGQTDHSGYSLSSTATGCGDSWPGRGQTATYTVNFQVASNEQKVTLNFSMVAKINSTTFFRFNTAKLYVDLENASAHSKGFGQTNGTNAFTLNLTYQVVPVYSKAPTTILIPGDNSTLSSLPVGLKRYTGEQNFVLLSINDTMSGTNSISVGGIPYVNKTAANDISLNTYSLNLSAGMNNMLVPRSYFKNSPLGEALLNGTNQSITSQTYNSFLDSQWNSTYWYARATGTLKVGNTVIDPPGSALYIKIYSSTNQNCTLGQSECGAVPVNLAAGQQVPALAIESIFALNISSQSDFRDLLAGLLLNTSGNFTGWGLSATTILPSLDLSAEVTSALANPELFSSGAYGAPAYQQPSPPPPAWQVVGSTIWNAISGTVGSLVSATWGWVQAAASYAAYLVKEVASWGLSSLNQVASVLKEVASAILWAIDQLASLILSAIRIVLSAAVSFFGSAFTSALSSWSATVGLATTYTDQYYTDTNSGQKAQNLTAAGAHWTTAVVPLLVAMGALTIAMLVAMNIIAPFQIGSGFISGILFSVLAAAFSSPVLSGALHVPSSLTGVLGTTTAFYTGVSEQFINLTDAPLTSAEALAIAVPDGDPAWAAGAGAFALIAFLVALLAGLRTVTEVNQKAGAQLAIGLGFLFALLGAGASVMGAINESRLPSTCASANKTYYQADQFLSWIGLIMAIGGATMIGYAARHGAPPIESGLGLTVVILAGGWSALDIHSIWLKCGTY